jgi:hypothetical protein
MHSYKTHNHTDSLEQLQHCLGFWFFKAWSWTAEDAMTSEWDSCVDLTSYI